MTAPRAPQGEHTPTPWRTGDMFHTVFGPPNGNPAPQVVATNLRKADALKIVLAVNAHADLMSRNAHLQNSHAALVAALRACVERLVVVDRDNQPWTDQASAALSAAENGGVA